MAAVKTFEDLDAWKLAEELKETVFAICERPAIKRDRKFCEDFRESARSAPSNIAEGFHRFRPRDNANFVRYALGSLGETKNHIKHASRRMYINQNEFFALWRLACRAIGASTKYHQYLVTCDPDGPPFDDKPSAPESPEP